jgi:hypothetical protein
LFDNNGVFAVRGEELDHLAVRIDNNIDRCLRGEIIATEHRRRRSGVIGER